MTSPLLAPATEHEGSADLRRAMNTFRFGPFVLSVERFALAREGVPVELPAGPFEILALLLPQPQTLVTRAQIARAIWPESDPEDVTHRINTAINRIRAVLGDNAAEPVYIQTVIGRGYRFIGTLEAESAASELLDQPSAETSADTLTGAATSGRRLWPFAAVFALLVVAAVVVLIARRRGAANAGVAPQFQASQVTFNQSENRVTAAAISPDGQRIAYADADGVRLKTLSQVDSTSVPTPPRCVISHLAWFADDQHIVISGATGSSDESDAWVLSVSGAPPRLLQKNAWRAATAPSGSAVAYTDSTHARIWVLDASGAAPRSVWSSADGAGTKGTTLPVFTWAPDGRTLLVERYHGGAQDADPRPGTEADPRFSLVALDTTSGRITATREGFRMDDAVISPSGTLLFSREQPGGLGLWTAPLQFQSQAQTGAIMAEPQLRSVTTKDARSFSMSLQGAVATLIQTRIPGAVLANFLQSPPAIADAVPLSSSSKDVYPHSWSLDSRQVYFEERHDASSYRIFRQALGEHDAVALAQSPNDQAFPLATPDGRWILFKGRDNVHAAWAWFRVPVQGGRSERLPLSGPIGEVRCPSTGTQCVLKQPDARGGSVFFHLDPIAGVVDPASNIHQSGDVKTAWDVSPSGRQLALLGGDSQHAALQVVTFKTQATQTLPIDVHEPVLNLHWAADSRGWFVTTLTATGSDIFYLEPSGKTTLLRKTSGNTWADPSPDGRKLVFVDQRNESNVWLLAKSLDWLTSGR